MESISVLAAPNTFRGTLCAPRVAEAMKQGLKRADGRFYVTTKPVADGGDGSLDAFLAGTGGTRKSVRVRDPLLHTISADYATAENGRRAFIEMAEASGLSLLSPQQYDPLRTSTAGTGDLIQEALQSDCEQIIVGAGGSATVDGGTGMARALGYRFLDEQGHEIPHGGGCLHQLHRIDASSVHPELKNARIQCACDVNNPLLGEKGAARTFAPQKGADPGEVEQLENNLHHLARVVRRDLGKEVSDEPGAGSAGGLGMGLAVFCDADLCPGSDLMLKTINFDASLANKDLVISGEGNLDRSSLHGKVPMEVMRKAKEKQISGILICGQISLNEDMIERVYRAGADTFFSLPSSPAQGGNRAENTRQSIERTTFHVGRALTLLL